MSKKKQGQDFYVFGEFWNGNEEENNIYLEKIEKRFDLVDVPLHNNLHKASLDGADYDWRQFSIIPWSKIILNML